jgi:hypothetical protein
VTREELFARDGWRCVYCGEVFATEQLTVDHVQPRSRGGDASGGNVVTACGRCNSRKGRLRLAEFLLADPVAHATFRRHAVHVWPRHLRALEEAITALARRRAASGTGTP